jgi:hypothetical protein
MHRVDHVLDIPNRYIKNVTNAAGAPQRAADNVLHNFDHALDAPNRVMGNFKGFMSKFGINI